MRVTDFELSNLVNTKQLVLNSSCPLLVVVLVKVLVRT